MLVVFLAIVLLAGCGGRSGSQVRPTVTVYSANGLGSWYKSAFKKFTDETGIDVELFEAGSGEVVSRLNSPAVWDRLNSDGKQPPPADLLVTLPPFIQKADKAGLLAPSGVDTAGLPSELVGPDGSFVPILETALCFIANPTVNPKPVSWQDLLAPRFTGKLQYSTPGEAGDGTALLLLLQHLMGKQGALDYLAQLGRNNVGPASSTASLQPKVDTGELLIANGDVQMNLASINNDGSTSGIFFPAMPDNSRTTISLPYVAGVTAAARRPDEAKLLLAFLLSDAAQRDASATAFGIPVRRTAVERESPPRNSPTAVLQGVTLWAPNWDQVLADLETDIDAYRKAVG
jgi:2-aminoethylphosphonate transport system substrate-binding protein